MARRFVRDGDQLICHIRPARTGNGFELVYTQDGEDHVEHYPLESLAKARCTRVEEDLIYDGWSLVA